MISFDCRGTDSNRINRRSPACAPKHARHHLTDEGNAHQQVSPPVRAHFVDHDAAISGSTRLRRNRGALCRCRSEMTICEKAFLEAGEPACRAEGYHQSRGDALVAYVCADTEDGETDWHAPALKTVAEALAAMPHV